MPTTNRKLNGLLGGRGRNNRTEVDASAVLLNLIVISPSTMRTQIWQLLMVRNQSRFVSLSWRLRR
eukprot:scaffold46526_cov153-Skeletonema_marinoi.AAC.3